jgi:hypothetical protein
MRDTTGMHQLDEEHGGTTFDLTVAKKSRSVVETSTGAGVAPTATAPENGCFPVQPIHHTFTA